MIDPQALYAAILLAAIFIGGPLWLAAIAFDEWRAKRIRAARRRARRAR